MKNRRRNAVRWLVVIGVLFVVLSYLNFLVPEEDATLRVMSAFWLLYFLGLIFFFDRVTVVLDDTSLLREIFRSGRNFWYFILVGALGGVLLDGVMQWLSKMWIYPQWNNSVYIVTFVLGFSLYWLAIAESYLAAKSILRRVMKREPRDGKYYTFEPKLYKALGVFGVVLFPLGVLLILRDYALQGGYVFDIVNPLAFKVNLLHLSMIFFGIWFLLEYLEYKEKKTSLLKDIFHHREIPILAILLSSFVLALFMETVNLGHGYWVYTNLPFQHVTFFGVPLLVFLGWPFHVIGFLSLFRVVTDEESREIWR